MLLLLRSRWDFHPVYNFHSRSSNNSFLRRGATSNSSLRKHSSQINLWCPSLQQKLPLIQSPPVPHALSNPGTPIMKSPNYSMPRCRSENLMDQSTKQKLSPSSKPILMTSSAERLSATEANTADLHRKPSNNTRHVSWGAAASTIRATYRFSHGRPRTSPALSPSSPVLHRQQSRTVMPWKWMPNTRFVKTEIHIRQKGLFRHCSWSNTFGSTLASNYFQIWLRTCIPLCKMLHWWI